MGKLSGNFQFKPQIFSSQTFRPIARDTFQKIAQLDFGELQIRFLRFEPGKAEQIINQQVESVGMTLHYLVNVARLVFIEIAGLEQGFEVAMKNRKWRPQFVGNVGDEIPPDLVGLF